MPILATIDLRQRLPALGQVTLVPGQTKWQKATGRQGEKATKHSRPD